MVACAAVLVLAAPGSHGFTVPTGAALYPNPPELSARAALMIDVETGTVLYERNADEAIPPASLTKVAGMYTVFEAVELGQAALNDTVEIPANAWARNMPPYSSLMFLGPGQEVTLEELLYGLAILSGNDAAVAVATHVSGGERQFVARMNHAMRRLGLEQTRFVEAAGLSAENTTTAREFTRFLYAYLQRRPDALTRFHALPEYSYPLEHNRTPDNGEPTITQANRNVLLREYDGADGIKTGYIPASRYNLAFTAARDGRRLLGVLLGVPGDNHIEGGRERARQAAALLDYGFDKFTNREIGAPDLGHLTVWFGTAREVAVRADGHDVVTLPRGLLADLEGEVILPREHEAPLTSGTRIGELRYTVNGELLHVRSLYAAESVDRGSLPRVLWDHIRRFFRRLGTLFAKPPLLGHQLPVVD